MSHNPTYRDYAYTANPKKIESSLADFVRHACWQEGGSLVPIKWNDKKTFNSYDEAYDYLESTDNGWYDNRAVVYLDTSKVKKESKKLDDLRRRLKEWYDRKNAIVCTYHFAEAKASLIGCKTCGSKIAVEFMRRRNNCPVCGKSMLSDTKQAQLERAKEMIESLTKEVRAEEKSLHEKALNKAEKRWLVYFDYHT